jgi:hypothetical protein
MSADTVAVLAVLVFGWAAASGALARRNVTGPLIFATAGYIVGNPDWGPMPVDVEASSIHLLAEVTLALLLFTDASRVSVRELRADATLPVRLLGIGLPLSVVAGAIIAGSLLDLPWGLALFLGAALARTDAALIAQPETTSSWASWVRASCQLPLAVCGSPVLAEASACMALTMARPGARSSLWSAATCRALATSGQARAGSRSV